MPHSTCPVRVVFAGLHPLSRENSRLLVGKEYAMHTTRVHQGTLLPSIDRLRPNVIVLDLLQTSSLRTIQPARARHESILSCRGPDRNATRGHRRINLFGRCIGRPLPFRCCLRTVCCHSNRAVWPAVSVAHIHEVAPRTRRENPPIRRFSCRLRTS